MIGTRESPAAHSRRGATLVEVLAATVILGGAVASMLLAQSAGLEQLRNAELQAVARNVAAELITNWRIESQSLAWADEGGVADSPGWSWRRTSERVQPMDGVLAARVVLALTYISPEQPEAIWTTQLEWLERHDHEDK